MGTFKEILSLEWKTLATFMALVFTADHKQLLWPYDNTSFKLCNMLQKYQ